MSTFEEDMKLMRSQVTQEVIYHINRDPQVYTEVTGLAKQGYDPEEGVKKLEETVKRIASEHEDWFGTVFAPELENVDWVKVAAGF